MIGHTISLRDTLPLLNDLLVASTWVISLLFWGDMTNYCIIQFPAIIWYDQPRPTENPQQNQWLLSIPALNDTPATVVTWDLMLWFDPNRWLRHIDSPAMIISFPFRTQFVHFGRTIPLENEVSELVSQMAKPHDPRTRRSNGRSESPVAL